MKFPIVTAFVVSSFALASCDVGPNGYGTAPPGVSQADWDAQQAARAKARRQYYAGPRGGASGR
ncbi:hypothetical protein TRL7639_02988 [Falsiruegeria litorea R37]|uniref:Lipoprotein n=1 Tax=Falsiruegeria litorea R37 TaxID=1200284 RepID=A0A1Y5T849_9RHOB|nr:hypothetical protein [Falsiruegeria litorea]SLN55950.1 hypothetical protein TRL7639_02988 [Falsiruegeria litorea R37]